MNDTEKKILEHGCILEYGRDSIALIPFPRDSQINKIGSRATDIVLISHSEDRLIYIEYDLLDVFPLLKQLRSEYEAGQDTASRINCLLADDTALLRVYMITPEMIILKDCYHWKRFLLANGTRTDIIPHSEDILLLVWDGDPPGITDLFVREMTADENGIWHIGPIPNEYYCWVFETSFGNRLADLDDEDLERCGYTVRFYAAGELLKDYTCYGYDPKHGMTDPGGFEYPYYTDVSMEVQFHGLCTKENYRDYYDLHLYLVH